MPAFTRIDSDVGRLILCLVDGLTVARRGLYNIHKASV